jgi:ribbon-helix-helix CopG family protein
MAIPKIKATYSLDAETVRLLERLARKWEVSKSEALRRAIRASAEAAPPSEDRLAVFDRLQRSLGLTKAGADAWVRENRAMRRASSRHRGF